MLNFGKENKINNLKDESIGLDLEKNLKDESFDSDLEKNTPLSLLRDRIFKSKATKAIFMSAILLKSIAPSFASNNDNKVIDKDILEHNINNKKESDKDNKDGKTFKTNPEDYKRFQEKIILKAGSNFDSSKSTLKNVDNIKSSFNDFLSKIDNTNFSNIINKDWIVKGSSDEIQNQSIGGNEKLTQDRIDALRIVLEETLKNHNFEGKLNEDQIKKILEKEIKENSPDNGKEKGVTYITDLINPTTGKNYTEIEVKELKENNTIEYKKLLSDCRYTNFELKIDNEKMFNLDNYDQAIFLVDNSGSMHLNKPLLGSSLDNALSSNKEKSIWVYPFSYKLDWSGFRIIDSKKPSLNTLSIEDFKKGNGNERALSSAIEFLKMLEEKMVKNKIINKLNPDFKRILYVATDEGIQDPKNILELERLLEVTHTDIEFILFYNDSDIKVNTSDDRKFLKVDFETLKKRSLDANNKTLGDINTFKDSNGKEIRFGSN
jgi:hypothetical protein